MILDMILELSDLPMFERYVNIYSDYDINLTIEMSETIILIIHLWES